jgi:hypothetical protein
LPPSSRVPRKGLLFDPPVQYSRIPHGTADTCVPDIADWGAVLDTDEIISEATTGDLAEDERFQRVFFGVGQSIDRLYDDPSGALRPFRTTSSV